MQEIILRCWSRLWSSLESAEGCRMLVCFGYSNGVVQLLYQVSVGRIPGNRCSLHLPAVIQCRQLYSQRETTALKEGSVSSIHILLDKTLHMSKMKRWSYIVFVCSAYFSINLTSGLTIQNCVLGWIYIPQDTSTLIGCTSISETEKVTWTVENDRTGTIFKHVCGGIAACSGVTRGDISLQTYRNHGMSLVINRNHRQYEGFNVTCSTTTEHAECRMHIFHAAKLSPCTTAINPRLWTFAATCPVNKFFSPTQNVSCAVTEHQNFLNSPLTIKPRFPGQLHLQDYTDTVDHNTYQRGSCHFTMYLPTSPGNYSYIIHIRPGPAQDTGIEVWIDNLKPNCAKFLQENPNGSCECFERDPRSFYNTRGTANYVCSIVRGSTSQTTQPPLSPTSQTTWLGSSPSPQRNTGQSVNIEVIAGSVAAVVVIVIVIAAIVYVTRRRQNRSRGGNAQNETTNGNEGERTSKKSDSSTSSPGQAAGNGSKSGGSTPRSSSSGSDKPSTNPNYTSTALQEVEIHPYMDLHTRDPTYASTTSSKDPHMYMELKPLKALQPGSEKNGNDGYETPQVPGQANKSSDGYETPQPPREGRRRSATYANQGVPADPIQEEVNYYNEA